MKRVDNRFTIKTNPKVDNRNKGNTRGSNISSTRGTFSQNSTGSGNGTVNGSENGTVPSSKKIGSMTSIKEMAEKGDKWDEEVKKYGNSSSKLRKRESSKNRRRDSE